MHNSTFNLNFYREIFCALQVGENSGSSRVDHSGTSAKDIKIPSQVIFIYLIVAE